MFRPSLVVIRWETHSFAAAGIRRHSATRSLIWIVVLTAIIIGLVTPVLQPLIDQLTGTKTDYSAYGALRGNIKASVRLIGLAWLSAALGEELVFRCFLMHQLERLLSTFRGGQITSSIVGGAIFGLMHAAQGIAGVLLTGIVGSIFCFAYLRSDRNAWALIVAHGLIDTWGVFTLYKGWY
ncbi:CPBP family intramembrane glutamic endopeptidase [Xanthomonas vasicola]|uniref:CPBP family intramembrane glutamic endopeptidase n=3 Tax=Xanthomonas vasicola TaxID=56459 RepID=UPI0009E68F28|nr:CPBP family intramembrane glutamic endopeptidase [Xanthomonas vasicola]